MFAPRNDTTDKTQLVYMVDEDPPVPPLGPGYQNQELKITAANRIRRMQNENLSP
ncbi:hypothetical protein [Streptomyces sp. YGL11-2]|uniref:hypothetical protein n=1 Tax=Streptomyces sp. YGL11-2 TaxID=3414028 RepID=UPI003CF6046A